MAEANQQKNETVGLTAEQITEELRKKTIEFFERNKIDLPIRVRNGIDDVFDENDFTSDEEDVINIYFKEDLEDFEKDTVLSVDLNIQATGGNSSGDLFNKFTYYEDNSLDTKNAVSQHIHLYDGEDRLDSVLDIDAIESNHLENPNDWGVFLIEEQRFEMGNYEKTQRLYIYSPLSGKGVE